MNERNIEKEFIEEMSKLDVEIIRNNCVHVYNGSSVMLISYGRKIAIKNHKNETVLDPHYWEYSKTTKKHLAEFLDGESFADIREKVEQGIYDLSPLGN